MSLQKAVLKKEKGRIPFPTYAALNDAGKVKTGLYRYRKKQSKNEKGQMPFPTDRALNDADKVKQACVATKKP